MKNKQTKNKIPEGDRIQSSQLKKKKKKTNYQIQRKWIQRQAKYPVSFCGGESRKENQCKEAEHKMLTVQSTCITQLSPTINWAIAPEGEFFFY